VRRSEPILVKEPTPSGSSTMRKMLTSATKEGANEVRRSTIGLSSLTVEYWGGDLVFGRNSISSTYKNIIKERLKELERW